MASAESMHPLLESAPKKSAERFDSIVSAERSRNEPRTD